MTCTLTLKLDIGALWHMGTGRGSGPDLDAQVFRTPAGLPCIPGRTLKGLLREAVETAERAGVYGAPDTRRSVAWFGTPLPRPSDAEQPAEVMQQEARFATQPGLLRVDTAHLGQSPADVDTWEAWARAHPAARDQLFCSLATTRIDAIGIAADKTLRSIEAAVPMTLFATIQADADGWQDDLARALIFLDAVGSHRTRALGRCLVSVVAQERLAPEVAPTPEPPEPPTAAARVLTYRLTLRSDVAVTATAATSGGHRTLPYVPGASILGAVARTLYHQHPDWTRDNDWTLFFSGEVRFGHATLQGSAPAPLALHATKTQGTDALLGAFAPGINLVAQPRQANVQLQQLRDRWMLPSGEFVKPARRQSMRTAIGAEGRARDGFLYELDALAQGQDFFGTITVDTGDAARNDTLARRIHQALHGRLLNIGRSAHQEFGRVEAQVLDQALGTLGESAVAARNDRLVVWCLSDLALVDAQGQPTFTPDPRSFHLPEGWQWSAADSFVRHRAWSPFRHRRSTTSEAAKPFMQRPGAERSVIAAGSVLVFVRENEAPAVDLPTLRQKLCRGVGLHRSEGLGCVLVEPAILATALPPDAAVAPVAPVAPDHASAPAQLEEFPPLATWAMQRAQTADAGLKTWQAVRSRLEALRGVDVPGAAQWGALRDELLRRQGDPQLVEKLRQHLVPNAPPREGTQNSGNATQGGRGRRALLWSQCRVGHEPLVDWLLRVPENTDTETLRMTLLQLCTWIVRQRRQSEGQGVGR